MLSFRSYAHECVITHDEFRIKPYRMLNKKWEAFKFQNINVIWTLSPKGESKNRITSALTHLQQDFFRFVFTLIINRPLLRRLHFPIAKSKRVWKLYRQNELYFDVSKKHICIIIKLIQWKWRFVIITFCSSTTLAHAPPGKEQRSAFTIVELLVCYLTLNDA